MTGKKIPMRMCVGCRQMRPKKSFCASCAPRKTRFGLTGPARLPGAAHMFAPRWNALKSAEDPRVGARFGT